MKNVKIKTEKTLDSYSHQVLAMLFVFTLVLFSGYAFSPNLILNQPNTIDTRTASQSIALFFGCSSVIAKFSEIKNEVELPFKSTCDVMINREYFDGLGLSLQCVAIKANPSDNKDLIYQKEYNGFGS